MFRVRSVLGMLPALLGSCKELDAQAVGNMMYGNAGHDSDVPEVSSVLGMLLHWGSCKRTAGCSGSGICCTVCRA
jgi:hypothetical protein